MAIINPKRLEADEETERNVRQQAEEYASRNDTAWQQPPPAYEEAAGQSSSSSYVSRTRLSESVASSSARDSTLQQDIPEENSPSEELEEQSRSRRERRMDRGRSAGFSRDSNQNDSQESDDEMTPLLDRRRRKLRKKKLFCHFIIVLLFVGILLMMFFNLFHNNKESEYLPDPYPSDGRPVESPNWTPGKKTPRDTWKSPSIPEYTCGTTFSLPASSASTFVRAYGSSYSGLIRTGSADEIPISQWKIIHGENHLDRIAVVIQAKYTDRYLLDRIRINKMVDKKGEKILAEGVSLNANHHPIDGKQVIYLNIDVLLPNPSYRTHSGLARDNSSFIPSLDLSSDNLRIVSEGFSFNNPDRDGREDGVSFGKYSMDARAGGISLGTPIIANESITMRVDAGQIRDIYYQKPVPIIVAAPRVDLKTVSGAIWITGVVGVESVDLRAISGGLNVSHLAVAKQVRATTRDGILGGRYGAYESFSVQTNDASLRVEVVANQTVYLDSLKKSGLLGIMDPERVRKLIEGIERNSKNWRTLTVRARTLDGAAYIKYTDQDERTQLLSDVRTGDGSSKVSHSSGFQGEYEIQNKAGSVHIRQPSFNEPEKEKEFTIDYDKGRNGYETHVRGRLWYRRYKWEDGGSSRSSAFPISRSDIHSIDGSVMADFS